MVSVRETQFSNYILEANKLGKQIILLQCSNFKKRKLTRFDSASSFQTTDFNEQESIEMNESHDVMTLFCSPLCSYESNKVSRTTGSVLFN